MALEPCQECGKHISENARNCPDCGAPYPSKKEWKGSGFEWKSQKTIYEYPFIHIAFGRNEKGKLRVAIGFITIGQFAIGAITIGQFGVGILFGFGQFIFGLTSIAQVAISLLFGCGQIATGYIAGGQLVLAYYSLAQVGLAKYLWSGTRKDPEAIALFHQLAEKIGFSLNRYIRK